ncbi:MAG TPA: hypothetical protein VGA78_01770, partial [Gemmatimonadales bacterium]
SDISYPTGAGDASIAAGNYTLNMYFNALPTAGSPAVAATNTSVNNTANTQHTVSLPSGIQSGNLLIVVFGYKAGSSQTITWPGGWTQFFRSDRSTNVGVAAAYRQADGSEGATITVQTGTSAKTSHLSYRITGAENPATQPPESLDSNGNSTTPDPPSLTPTGGAKDYLWIAVELNNHTGTSIPITAFPANYSGSIQANGDTNNSTTGAAYRQLNAASEDPSNFSIGTAIAWAAGTLVVHPASNPSVDVQVSVSHTALDGSGATTIVQSSTTTINSSTPDPLTISIDSGALQTFTAADPRLLRVNVQVTAVSGSGFVLDFDGSCAANRCSSLDTPAVTVPEVTLLLVVVVVLIPILTYILTEKRRRRIAARLISVVVSLLLALGLLSRDVLVAIAAPDSFYLHDTDTSGITPAGEYMNSTAPTEPTPPAEFPAEPIYRSIGTNSGTLYSTGNASINAGQTAVNFGGGASLPSPTAVGAVGVGDKLVIGSETFFILSRDSATQVTVQAAAASTHTDEAYTITRAYNSFQAWEDPCGATPCLPTSSGGRGGNLVGENRIEVGVAYKDGVFSPTTTTLVNGSTTDANYYMRLTVGVGQRHSGVAGT